MHAEKTTTMSSDEEEENEERGMEQKNTARGLTLVEDDSEEELQNIRSKVRSEEDASNYGTQIGNEFTTDAKDEDDKKEVNLSGRLLRRQNTFTVGLYAGGLPGSSLQPRAEVR
jgi:hypothetical protein